MEYLEKILYSLLIYLIPGLFFIFGLLLAYLLWYRHSLRLNVLVNENRELQRDIRAIDPEDLKTRLHGKVNEKVQSVNEAWHYSHSTQEQHLKDSLRQLEAQKIQLLTAKSELDNKSVQLQHIDESFTIYKYDKEAQYNEILKEKDALLSQNPQQRVVSDEAVQKLNELQVVNAEQTLESQKRAQKISEQEMKIKDLENQLKLASTTSSNADSLDVTVKTSAEYFANTQAHNHFRYGYIFDNKSNTLYTDKLVEINGVSDELESQLNQRGIYQFKQIALWNLHQAEAFQHDLDFDGSIQIEQWVNQAADLHQEKYEEMIDTPVARYHSDKQTHKISVKAQELLLKEFEGQDVRVEGSLGVVYNAKPTEVDDFKLIRGVASVLEEKLNDMGIYRFRQIANWDVKQMAEFSNRLDFPGRIEKDDWKIQAKRFHLAKYGEVIG